MCVFSTKCAIFATAAPRSSGSTAIKSTLFVLLQNHEAVHAAPSGEQDASREQQDTGSNSGEQDTGSEQQDLQHTGGEQSKSNSRNAAALVCLCNYLFKYPQGCEELQGVVGVCKTVEK